MPRRTPLWLLLAFAAAAAAQDEAAPEPPADEAAAEAAEAAEAADDAAAGDGIDPELLEDTELDEQTYEEDEDEFIPTEEIPADEPIPFPTNI